MARLWRREVRDGQDTEDSWNGIDLHDLRRLDEEDIHIKRNLKSLFFEAGVAFASWRINHYTKSRVHEYLRNTKQEVRIEMMEIDATFLKNLNFISPAKYHVEH